jgi:hypothetical protein
MIACSRSSDDGDLVAVRYENWKIVFIEQRVEGTLRVWAEPFTVLRMPKLFDVRADPYERADITSNTYYDWMISNGSGAMFGALTRYEGLTGDGSGANFTAKRRMQCSHSYHSSFAGAPSGVTSRVASSLQ